MSKLKKLPYNRPPLEVHPGGALEGHTFLMRRLPARDWIKMRRGDITDGELTEIAFASIEDSTMELDQLDMVAAIELMRAWVRAHREAAVPPESGTSSDEA